MNAMSAAAEQYSSESAYALGELREEFSASGKEVAGVAIMAVGAVIGFGAIFFHAMLPLLPPGRWPLVLCGVACAGISLALAPEAYRYWRTVQSLKGMRVLVFAEGFVSIRPTDVFACRWDEVAWTKELFANATHGVGPFLNGLTVHCQDGREWTLDRQAVSLFNSSRLAATIQQQVAQRQLPQALAELRRGGTLDFGAVKFTLLGIMQNDRLLSWADLKAVVPHGFGLKIQRRGGWLPWATIAGSNLVNRYLLVAMTQAMSGKQHGGARISDAAGR